MSFTGGKLTFKGGVDPLLVKKKKKKGKKKKKEEMPAADAEAVLQTGAPEHAKERVANPEGVIEDRRTEAEKRRDAHMLKYEKERAKKAATRSHRQRIEEFNKKLATLTEHHDIPKISYSYM